VTSPGSAPLRILQVAAPARTGGLESVALQLSRGLRQRGHDVQVAAVLTPGTEQDHPFLEALHDLGIPVHVILVRGRAYLREQRAVEQLARSLGTDVLHTHGYRADILHGSSARAVGARHVMTLHGFVSGNWRDRLYESLQLRAARSAESVIAVSQPIVDRLYASGTRENVRLVRNALGVAHDPFSRKEARQRLGLRDDLALVGWVGRLSEEKGPDLFVRALASSASHVEAVIIGDGPMREQVAQLAAELGVQHRLHMTGNVPQASRYFSALDALAMTSRTEGTPMVMLEAMNAAVPVVTTMVGGIPDVVSQQEAWCCPPGDVQALASSFAEAVQDSPLRVARIARAASLVADRFNVDRWLDDHLQVYAERLRSNAE
jgi:glycosyltransferase involved in cell wall biosynthesis